jgi:flagellar hook-associated protein 2
MATISSAGIGSGLDVNGIVTQLLAIERQPLAALEREETQLTSRLSEFGKLQSMVSAMRDKASALTSSTLWMRSTGSSADAASVNVTTSSGAAVGAYAVQVARLATQQTVSSPRFTTTSPGTFGAGSLTIELGATTGTTSPEGVFTATGFTPKAGAAAVTVTFTAEDDTLAEMRDKINAADAGVVATVVNDVNGSRLAIRSKDTGAEQGFRLTGTDSAAQFGFDPLAASPMTLNQRAVNALATINGIEVESASNTLANVSDGVTLQLLRTTSAPVEIKVASDSAAMKTALEDFVKSYNELSTYIAAQTKYDEVNKRGGPMQGDSLVLGIQRQMRAVMANASSASSLFGRLSDIGITAQRDGTLVIDSAKLDNGLADLPELRKLLATDGADTATSGFMQRFKELGDVLLGADGAFDNRSGSLRARLDRNDDRQSQMQARLQATEKRLRDQYTALDRNMGQLNGLSSYVTQQMQALNNFYTARSNGG